MALPYTPRDLQYLINRAIVVSRWAELYHKSFCEVDAMRNEFFKSPHLIRAELMTDYSALWHRAWSAASYSQASLESYIERIKVQLVDTPFGVEVRDLGFEDFVDGVGWARARLNAYRAPDGALLVAISVAE